MSNMHTESPLYFRYKMVRDDKKVSDRWLSKRTGISRKRLRQLENGAAEFTKREIDLLAYALGTNIWVDP